MRPHRSRREALIVLLLLLSARRIISWAVCEHFTKPGHDGTRLVGGADLCHERLHTGTVEWVRVKDLGGLRKEPTGTHEGVEVIVGLGQSRR